MGIARSRLRRALGMLVVAAGPTWGQSVILQVKPHVGDTLRMRLDQQTEMTGVRRTAAGEASAMLMNSMKMFSRAIVEGAAERGTSVLAITDSVLLTTSDDHARAGAKAAELQMRGQRVQFRVAPDGAVAMDGGGDDTREVAQVVSLMPAAFPKARISVGESWVREMPLPTGAQLGAQLSGKLHVTFRFDSLTHGGEWAFISMRGEMQPATGPGAASETVLEKGLVNGTMLMDQKRGWLTESWFSIIVSSVTTPPAASGIRSMHMQMRITQHMRTAERR
jgi:hypothetical protein